LAEPVWLASLTIHPSATCASPVSAPGTLTIGREAY